MTATTKIDLLNEVFDRMTEGERALFREAIATEAMAQPCNCVSSEGCYGDCFRGRAPEFLKKHNSATSPILCAEVRDLALWVVKRNNVIKTIVRNKLMEMLIG